ncbi:MULTISPECIES: SDR family oxidoreductase [unclassified Halomonas]|uniref:SDR family oxidoreductase n=1 Tax=unclassified Halomonas TaxID=2609666 RepID=UPI001EF68991|nr:MULTISPECIES: SDR family oxidoreductase [unclassified Halomonas]MCG7578237.1 SDR family oxidoreductase [Halomonas sp. MMH1-48]MCG7605296.1 SDR family oxidoreductase [Halomonas sp. MM17-34]MCG7614487.1 SDR family oxidoreductase [Halomonas sp. MM17-29]MCG7621389.1 SDR family oxidoreductase [Halomonas sp. DSH1-27]
MTSPCTYYVTGGAQGIGLGIAHTLLAKGHRVVITDIDGEALDAAAQRLPHPSQLLTLTADVSDEAQVMASLEKSVNHFGQLNGIVHNAGIADPFHGPVEQLSLETWQAYLDTNLTGAFLCAKHGAAYLRPHGGSMVLMASSRAIQSEPDTEAYAASKGGIVALTHALAVSLGPDIRVNAISPGWIEVGDWQKPSRQQSVEHRDIDREQHPAGRVGTPEDIASLTHFLLSKESGFITGQNFVVDGGMTRKMIYAE